MGNKKITGVADGVDDNDAVNMKQINKLQINKLIYYYGINMRHSNSTFVDFRNVHSDSFISSQYTIKFKYDGTYEVIYSDFYKNGGLLRYFISGINGTEDAISLINKDDWTPFTFNFVISANSNKTMSLSFNVSLYNGRLRGGYSSSLYIKYIGPIASD